MKSDTIRRFAAGVVLAALTTGSACAAPAPGLPIAAVVGIVDDSAAENGVVWFTLQQTNLRFQVKVDDLPDPDAVFAALRASAQSERSLVVHYDIDSGAIEADPVKARFDFRDLVFDGKTIAGAAHEPPQGPPLSKAEADLARGVGLGDAGDFAAARVALGEALAAPDLAFGPRALALKTRGEDAEYEGILGFPRGLDRDRLLVLALGDFRAWRALSPDESSAAYDEGRLLQDLGAYGEALDVFRAMAAKWPKEAVWTSVRIADAYRLMGDNVKALATLDDLAARAGPQKGMTSHYYRGWILANLGRNAEAVAEFTARLVEQPDYPWAFSRRACALAKEGRLADALDDQTRMIALLAQLRYGGEPTLGDRHNDQRAAEVASELQAAIAKSPNAMLDAPCKGYWDEGDVGRDRSALLPPTAQ
ncbi:MAG: tetratricopeptide repeat protein [Caulobacteraceae bacterium]